jgi:hypothetical protein
MALSAPDADRLAKLQAAYDALLTGAKETSVKFADGRGVDYAAGDMTKLKSEIDQLNAKASPRGRSRGAIGFRV